MSYANNPCAIYEVAIRLEVLYVSCYCSQCRRKMKMNLHVNAFSIATVICKFCFWSVQNLSDDAKVTVHFSGNFIKGSFEKVKTLAFFCHKWLIL